PCYITGADPARMLAPTGALAARRRPARAAGGCARRRPKGCRLLPRLRDLLERLAGLGLRAGPGGDITERQHADQMLVMVDDRHASDLRVAHLVRHFLERLVLEAPLGVGTHHVLELRLVDHATLGDAA